MALTQTQRARVRLSLGFPDIYRYQNAQLEGLWDSLSLEAEARIIDIIAKLEKCDVVLDDTVLTNAGIKRVDEIWFFEAGAQRREVQNLGRMWVSRLSSALGVPIYADIYGNSGFPGDSYWPGGSGGNVIRLG